MRPEEHNLFNLVRREILASEDILEMLPIQLRHQVKIVQEEINKMENHPVKVLQKNLDEFLIQQKEKAAILEKEEQKLKEMRIEAAKDPTEFEKMVQHKQFQRRLNDIKKNKEDQLKLMKKSSSPEKQSEPRGTSLREQTPEGACSTIDLENPYHLYQSWNARFDFIRKPVSYSRAYQIDLS